MTTVLLLLSSFSSLISLSVLRVWWEAANSASGMGEGRTSQRRTVLQPLGVLIRGEAIATMIPPPAPRFPTAPIISSPPTTLTSAAKTLIGAKLLQLAAANCTTGGHHNTRNHTTRASSGTCFATSSRSTGPRADGPNHHGSGAAWIENRLKMTRGSAKNRAGSVFTYAEDLVTERRIMN